MADEQELSRTALTALLEAAPGFRVVAEARSLQEADALCRKRQADVLLIDTRLPAPGGLSPIRSLQGRHPDAHALALVHGEAQRCSPRPRRGSEVTPHGRGVPFLCCPRADCYGRALTDGAKGVIRRRDSARSLFAAVRRVASGRLWFGTNETQRMIRCAAEAEQAISVLTPRERQVAAAIGEGRCNKEIADRLRISIATVKKHVSQILIKLRLEDRLQLGLLVSRTPSLLGRRAAAPEDVPPPRRQALPR